MLTEVVNVKKQRCTEYIGRGSPFGNPHVIGYCNLCNRVHDRRDSINEFKKYFYKRLTNPEFRSKVLALKGKKLGCWCVPLNCHGNIIKEYLDYVEL